MSSYFRLLKLIAHIGVGLVIISFILPKKKQTDKAIHIKRWSIKLLKILRVKVVTYGTAPEIEIPNRMFLANHISWLDIFALYTVFNSRFVAKSDIESWPIINRLCKAAGTFFIQREKIKDTKRVNESITQSLINGEAITFFPEGTTSDGRILKPMKTSLLQSIITSQGTVQAIYLNYVGSNGKHSDVAAYIDEISMLDSLMSILNTTGLEVHLNFLPVIDASTHDRASISSAVKAQLHEANLNFQHLLADKPVEQEQKIFEHHPA